MLRKKEEADLRASIALMYGLEDNINKSKKILITVTNKKNNCTDISRDKMAILFIKHRNGYKREILKDLMTT